MEVQEEIIKDNKLTPIQSFYKGSKIFLTGGTGFLGQILLEKLLRSCPDISTIYILVRNKKGKNITTRIDELFDDIVFQVVKKQYPKFRHKVVGVEGDCALPNLGLNEQDRETLINEVNIVFHAAATVRFDEKLNLAVAVNVKAPLFMVELATQMKGLKCFMHVSTAYTNCVQLKIEEKVYPPPMDCEQIIKIADSVPEKLLINMTPQLIGKWPNTYTFTKAIAENVIAKKAAGLPAAIFRPSIIISTYKEPIPAWINNVYGPTGICAAVGTGLLRTLHCDESTVGNMVPVDMCVNSMLVAAWEVGTNFEKNKEEIKNQEIPVYHYESSNDRPITWGHFMYLNILIGPNFATTKSIWYYSLTLIKNKYIYLLMRFLVHIIPAVIVDTVLWCMGKQPMMLSAYRKIHKFSHVLSYFTLRDFKFESHKFRKLCDTISQEDKEIFFFDLKELNWEDFFQIYLKGIRVYLLKDDMSTLPEARVKWRKLKILDQALKVIFLFLALKVLWSILTFCYETFSV